MVVVVTVVKESRCLQCVGADVHLDVNESAFLNGKANLLLHTALTIEKL